MSWSVNMIGKPEAVAAALAAEAEKLTGQSKVEFEAALPHLQGLVRENFARGEGQVEPVLRLEASGHGYAQGEEQIRRALGVKLESFYAQLV